MCADEVDENEIKKTWTLSFVKHMWCVPLQILYMYIRSVNVTICSRLEFDEEFQEQQNKNEIQKKIEW